MAGAHSCEDISMFNNPLLSDVTIIQTSNGVTKKFHAHKVVLCTASVWFTTALTGDFKEAQSGELELQDDDPIYFELLLRYIYSKAWDQEVASMKIKYGPTSLTRIDDWTTPIGVYALASKYEVRGLGQCAIEQIPKAGVFGRGALEMDNGRRIIEEHYGQCTNNASTMGLKICASLIHGDGNFALNKRCDKLVRKYRNFAVDLVITARANKGSLVQL